MKKTKTIILLITTMLFRGCVAFGQFDSIRILEADNCPLRNIYGECIAVHIPYRPFSIDTAYMRHNGYGFLLGDSLAASKEYYQYQDSIAFYPDYITNEPPDKAIKNGLIALGDVSTNEPVTIAIDTVSREIFDTSKILMLVCDTSQYEGIMMNGNIRKDLVDQRPYWIKGYEVRVLESGGITFSNYGDGGTYQNKYYAHKQYLDADKKELPKSIIVWQTK